MNKRSHPVLFLAAGLVFLTAISASKTLRDSADHWHWPQVIPLERVFDIRDVPNADIELQINGTDDKPLYSLVCLGLQASKKSKIDFDWSADFECRLSSLYSKNDYGTLLTYDPRETRDWESRGGFMPDQIMGVCANYPEYGDIRHFRLRGIELTLSLSDVHLAIGQRPTGKGTTVAAQLFKSFRLTVNVKQDPAAFSTIAGPVPYAEPKSVLGKGNGILNHSCGTIVPQHVPGIVTSDYIREGRLNPPYPRVVPATKSGIVLGPDQTPEFYLKPWRTQTFDFNLPIRDASGATAYRFRCSSNPASVTGISCGLFQSGRKIDLLTDSRDAYSLLNRANIYPEQLLGKCTAYPDWGAERIFLLRGFRLTMLLSQPVFIASIYDWQGTGLQSVTLSVSVKPDTAATSPVAVPPKYAYWNFVPHGDACEVPILNPWYVATVKN